MRETLKTLTEKENINYECTIICCAVCYQHVCNYKRTDTNILVSSFLGINIGRQILLLKCFMLHYPSWLRV